MKFAYTSKFHNLYSVFFVLRSLSIMLIQIEELWWIREEQRERTIMAYPCNLGLSWSLQGPIM